jgi:hypothetical protein
MIDRIWVGTRYDARIPTLTQTVGHDFGAEISSPDQVTMSRI